MMTRIPRPCASLISLRKSLSAAVHCQVAGSAVSFSIRARSPFGIGTEIRIDVMVAVAVVFVHRARVEEGIEIDAVDPEVARGNRACRSRPGDRRRSADRRRRFDRSRVPISFSQSSRAYQSAVQGEMLPVVRRLDRRLEGVAGRIVCRIAVAKTLRKNLVENRFGGPGRRGLKRVERDAFVLRERVRSFRAARCARDDAKSGEERSDPFSTMAKRVVTLTKASSREANHIQHSGLAAA